jgi:hypothetical protein
MIDCWTSKTDDAAAFLRAMQDVRLSHGPIGPVRLDEYGTPVLDIYIRKVARVNGKLANTIVKTYPQVSQFWTYNPRAICHAADVLARLSAKQKPGIAAKIDI